LPGKPKIGEKSPKKPKKWPFPPVQLDLQLEMPVLDTPAFKRGQNEPESFKKR
jgi:hypothetical protein